MVKLPGLTNHRFVPNTYAVVDASDMPTSHGELQVAYLVYDGSIKDGRIGLGVFASLDRAQRACSAAGGAPIIAIRPALVDGPVTFAQDKI